MECADEKAIDVAESALIVKSSFHIMDVIIVILKIIMVPAVPAYMLTIIAQSATRCKI